MSTKTAETVRLAIISEFVYARCIWCSRVRYCSEACCLTSWESYHRIECNFLDLLHAVWYFLN